MNIKTITSRKPWDNHDAKQVINLYLTFLDHQINGVPYQKAKPVRELAEKQGRSKGSIEAKMMNISAVLNDHKKPFVAGYKPLSNYNKALVDQVAKQVGL